MPQKSFLLAIVCLSITPFAWAEIKVSSLHPRVYVRDNSAAIGKGLSVSQLRSRLKDPAYSRWRREQPGRGGAEAIVERAARYLEEGNSTELEAVRDFLSTHTFSYEKNDVGGFLAGAEMAIAYDWVYAGLSEADRAAAMANIVTTAESSRRFLARGGPDINHNYTYMALNTVAVCGLVLKGEIEPYNQTAEKYLALARDFLEAPGMVLDTWNAREGAWGEGSHYTFHETLRNLVMMLAAYRTASDQDYFARIRQHYGNFLEKAGRFLIGSTRPDMSFERIGDSSSNRVQANITVPLTVEVLAWGFHDEESARLRSFSDALQKAYGEKAVHPFFDWGMRIFYDPRAPRTPSYQTLPLAMRMGRGTYEHIVFRNGWTPNSTQITILGGDHFTDHQHFDKGHFLIYHRGGLTVDGGAYDGMYRPNGHPNEYASRTLAHNCMLVYDPEQVFPKGYGNDGGQNVLRGKQHHHDWPTYLTHREKEGLDTADVVSYDHGPKNQYDYVRINLKRAYSDKVTYYDRQFVYIPSSDFLVVFDRVSTAQPGFKKSWLLHFQDRPEIDGKTPEPGVQVFPGSSLTTERRHGEWDAGGQTFQYDGALFVHTLLPTERVITSIGGPGHEYYNAFNGMNYPPSRPSTAAEVRESGKWRLEVSPKNPSKDDLFLHALQMADSSVEKPVETRLVADSEGKLVGAEYFSTGENEIVLFSSDRNGAPIALPVSYEITSPLPAQHLLVELPPGQRVVIDVNGKKLSVQEVNSQGVLSFRDGSRGKRQITVRSEESR